MIGIIIRFFKDTDVHNLTSLRLLCVAGALAVAMGVRPLKAPWRISRRDFATAAFPTTSRRCD